LKYENNKICGKNLYKLKTSIDENKARIIYQYLPTVRADENLMMQLFHNLIANSIQYKGKYVPEINISARKR